jgi:hypothetical protein
MTDEQAAKLGAKMIEVLQLRPSKRRPGHPDARYDTSWGDKTVTGLGHTIARIVAEQTEGAAA